jgi:hypothetical protein
VKEKYSNSKSKSRISHLKASGFYGNSSCSLSALLSVWFVFMKTTMEE